MSPRSLILVTGASAGGLRAARESGADIVCIDLEDTVPPPARAAARGLLVQALAQAPDPADGACGWGVRINPLSSADGVDDLLWLRTLSRPPRWVVLTMAVDPYELRLVERLLPTARRMLIVETAEALHRLPAFVPHADALWLGGKDLSAALGCSRAHGLGAARARTVAAVAGRVPVFDDVHRPFDDLDGLRAACAASRELGWTARVTLDPRQVAVIHGVH